MNRTVDNPVAVAGEQIGHENRSDTINDEDIEDRSYEEGNDQITSLWTGDTCTYTYYKEQ